MIGRGMARAKKVGSVNENLGPHPLDTGYGQESLSFRGSFLWNTLDDTIKNQPTLTTLKKRIKDWAGDKCTCKICR